MNPTFDHLYRQLGRVTFGVLIGTLAIFGVMLLCAILGFSHAVESFKGVAASLAYVFGALFSLFLIASVAKAVIGWLDRRSQIPGGR